MFKLLFSLSLFLVSESLILSPHTHAQTAANTLTPSTPPGILESLEKLVTINEETHKKLFQQASNIVFNYDDLKKIDIKSIQIHPDFLNIILFNSDEKYLSLIEGEQSECLLYTLLENRLLRASDGPVTQLVINAPKNNKTIMGIVKLDDFIKLVHEKQCYAFKQISSGFTIDKYLQTLKQIDRPVPSNKASCLKIMNDWKKNFHLPHICRIVETLENSIKLSEKIKSNPSGFSQLTDMQNLILEQSKVYKRDLSVFEKSYFKNVCDNINDPEKFCSIYLNENVWDQVIRGEKPEYLMKYKCMDILNKNPVTLKDFPKCKEVMETNPEICTKVGILKFPSLYPKPNCLDIARAYKSGKLVTDYQDCPARVDFESITNVSRKIFHYFPNTRYSTPDTCEYETYQPFAQTVMNEADEDIIWPLQYCFTSLITKEQECIRFIPGHHPQGNHSEEKVLANVLSKTKGASVNESCRKVSKDVYNPALLEYKSGCFIVIDSKKCNGISCQPAIYYQGRLVGDIQTKSQILFEYFPINYIKEKQSINSILKKNYPVVLSRIFDISILKNYFKENDDGIIYGIGCVQDILPQFFKVTSLNDCIPVPFIIDGYDKNQENILLSVRTSLDDLHSPRLIDWNFVFNAVSNFKEIHPLSTWTLYGIKKK